MLTSMYTAVSGMNANGTTLSVIGDNIANLNTVGFKSSSVSFGDVLSQSLSGGSSQIGRGVEVTAVSPTFTQGSFETTANGLDLAVDGDGLFIVSEGGANYYTRAGQFSLDKDGNIVNPDNLKLQGYLADPAGNITGATGDLAIATRQSPANASTTLDMAINLNAATTAPAAAFTLDANGDGVRNDPNNYNFSSSATIYDPQGGAHQVTMYFVKNAAPNSWTTHFAYNDPLNAGQLMEGGQASGGLGLPPAGVAITQMLTFNTDGSLNTDNSAITSPTFAFGGGMPVQNMRFNFGTGTAEVPPGSGLDMSSQYASDFSVMSMTQDGYAAGSLRSVSVSDAGIVTGVFTNGQTRSIGQVALARFVAPTMLSKMGRNLYSETFDSGQPIVGMANTSGMGKVLSNSLELSNVDLAQEFVNMISSQRGFEANSKIITTTDQLMQLLVNLKQ
jgi:flagellar hook protein FlgE